MGPLRPETIIHVQDYLRCGDLAAGFTRDHCPACQYEKLLPFTCKSRHFCPACHQRRTLQTGTWIAITVCQPVPHRQYVFTIPKILRTIFRKRRHPLQHLFQTTIDTLRDTFEPVHPLWQAIQSWIPDDEDEAPGADTLELWDQSADHAWKAPEIDLGDGRILVMENAE
jgi:hypothetical protein